MDQPSREQVRLILDDAVIRAERAVEDRLKRIYAKNAATGLLKSGATIKGVVGAVEEIGAGFIKRCLDDVAPVAKDFEAFAMIEGAVEGFLRFIAGKVDSTAEMAAGEDPEGRILKGARELYGTSQEALRRQLELQRFAFTVPQSLQRFLEQPLAPSPPIVAAASVPASPVGKSRGGKPLAEHWDAMWATIAVKLWAGDLKPKTQADIERAMKDWFAEADLNIGDTAIRSRARQLWQKMKDAE